MLAHERRRPKSAMAFVDWTAQMYNARARDGTPRERAQRTLQRTMRTVTKALIGEPDRFHVSLRLYAGWHKGWQATEQLKAATQAVESEDFGALSSSNTSFVPAVQFGHTLLEAVPERQHRKPPIHLPNTLREQDRSQRPTEKMVDTALATDLLSWARNQRNEWALVLAEDDDLVPPVLTAEAWVKRGGGRTLLVRKRPASQYVKLDGLLRLSS